MTSASIISTGEGDVSACANVRTCWSACAVLVSGVKILADMFDAMSVRDAVSDLARRFFLVSGTRNFLLVSAALKANTAPNSRSFLLRCLCPARTVLAISSRFGILFYPSPPSHLISPVCEYPFPSYLRKIHDEINNAAHDVGDPEGSMSGWLSKWRDRDVYIWGTPK